MDLKKETQSVSKLIKDIKIVKIDRQANRVAHEIMKFSFDSKFDGAYCNSVSSCVANLVILDCKNC